MDKQGWICLHRQIEYNWVWENKPFSYGQAWIDMLLLANHEKNRFPLGDEVITLEKGNFVTSELKLMRRWGWSKSKVRRFLKLLESDGMITKKTDHRKTTITVVNYEKFQHMKTNKKPLKNQSETDSRPIEDTNNNVNNDNNINNNIIMCSESDKSTPKQDRKKFIPPSVEQVQQYCKERNNSVDAQTFIDFYESKGWMIGKNKMKNWKAAVRTWEKTSSRQQSYKPKNSFNQFQQNDYDFEQLERELLDN